MLNTSITTNIITLKLIKKQVKIYLNGVLASKNVPNVNENSGITLKAASSKVLVRTNSGEISVRDKANLTAVVLGLIATSPASIAGVGVVVATIISQKIDKVYYVLKTYKQKVANGSPKQGANHYKFTATMAFYKDKAHKKHIITIP